MEQKELTREILIIVGAALFLGFILALKFEWPILSLEPSDFLIMSLLSLLILGVFVGAQKGVAHLLECKTRTKLLSFRRYWFGRTGRMPGKLPFTFPLWLVWPILLFFITIGRLRWLAILDMDIKTKSTRIGKQFYALKEDDVGKITLAGPLAVLALAIIVKAFGFTPFAGVCAWFAFLSLIPFGLGFKLLSSSRMIWLFVFIFSLLLLFLITLESLFAIICTALLFAVIAVISYYLLYEK